jgi:hypothetical protein
VRKLAAILLAFTFLACPALANELDTSSDDTEQVIPPAVVDNQVPTATNPLNLDEIEITTKTPADEFITATTPLLLALMLGSVGLVVYTILSQSGRESSRLD